MMKKLHNVARCIAGSAIMLVALGCNDQLPTIPDLTTPQLAVTSASGPSGPLLKIYFTDGGDDRTGNFPSFIRSVNPDGTGLATLVTDPNAGDRPRGIAVDDINGHIYWNDFGQFGIPGTTRKSNLDGTAPVVLYTHVHPTFGNLYGINDIDIDIAAGDLYISHSVSFSRLHGVRRAKTDGSSIVDHIVTWPPGAESPAGTITSWWVDGLALDLVNGHIYRGDPGVIVNDASSGIVRSNLDGSASTSLVPHLNGRGRGLGLDLAAGKMYFGQHDPLGSTNGRIWVANLDGTGLAVVVNGLRRPRDLALDLFAGKIYWVDEATRKIQRSNLDGTSVQDVVTNLAGPSSLALVFERTIKVDIDIKPGSDPNSINCTNEKEVIAVAILTTDDFDATTVDHATVTFAGASETHIDRRTGEPRRHEEDVDGDGDTDLVLHFQLGATDLDCDSTEGTLEGETFDGQAIEGVDAVRMVGIEEVTQ